MTTDHLTANDGEALRGASLFRKMRALTRAMRKGTAWRLYEGEAIRHGDKCPLTFAGGTPGCNPFQVDVAAKKMGLMHWTTRIMDAADYVPARLHRKPQSRRLRRILLRAAGLKERR